MVIEASIQQGAKMRHPTWVRLVPLWILLGCAAVGGTRTQLLAAANSRPPVGNLDQIDTNGQVAGWSADHDRPSAHVQVVLALDGNDLATVAANAPRPDVTAPFPKFV